MAEIPTFRERQAMDLDADGTVAQDEEGAYLDTLGPQLVSGLSVQLDGVPQELELLGRELAFPPGAGDLPTMRLELNLRVALDAGDGVSVTYRVTNYADRLGWRDIIAIAGHGTRIDDSSVGSEDPTDGLRVYPEDSLQDPPDIRSAEFRVSASPAAGPGSGLSGTADPSIHVPVDVDPLLGLFSGTQTPLTALLAILVSAGLGAVHAASPGHGKTLVAAYLVGSHGQLRQALWLSLTVAVTHTAGVFVLGLVTLTAGELLVPERVVTWLAITSGLIVVILGSSLVLSYLHGRSNHGDRAHIHVDGAPHHHETTRSHMASGSRAAAPRPLTRSTIALGLAGGLVPSASALIVFLLALTLGRLGFGIVLIVSFGIGMALVLGGVGFAVVLARRAQLRSTRGWAAAPLTLRVVAALPLLSGVAVLATGIVVTLQAATRLT